MALDTVPVKVFPSGKQGSRVDYNCWNTTQGVNTWGNH